MGTSSEPETVDTRSSGWEGAATRHDSHLSLQLLYRGLTALLLYRTMC